MSADKREDILVQLLADMQGIPGIVTAVRNRKLLATEERPAMVLLDGDELPPRLSMDTRRLRGRAQTMGMQVILLRPEVYIMLAENRPNNSEVVGSELNGFRIAFLSKVWTDATLAAILGANGNITYNGCETDLKSGSALSGQMRLDFFVTYTLNPT